MHDILTYLHTLDYVASFLMLPIVNIHCDDLVCILVTALNYVCLQNDMIDCVHVSTPFEVLLANIIKALNTKL